MTNLLKSLSPKVRDDKNSAVEVLKDEQKAEKMLKKIKNRAAKLKIEQQKYNQMDKALEFSRSEAQLWKQNYETVFNGAPLGFFTVFEDLVIKEVNPAGAKMLGKDRLDMLGESLSDYVGSRSREKLISYFVKAFNGMIEPVEIMLCSNNNSMFPARLEARVIKEKADADPCCLCAIVDMTELREAQDEIEIHKKQIVDIEKQRTEKLEKVKQNLQQRIDDHQQGKEQLIVEKENLLEEIELLKQQMDQLSQQSDKAAQEYSRTEQSLRKQLEYFRALSKNQGIELAREKQKASENSVESDRLKKDLSNQQQYYESLVNERDNELTQVRSLLDEKSQQKDQLQNKMQSKIDELREQLEEKNAQLEAVRKKLAESKTELEDTAHQLRTQIDRIRNEKQDTARELAKANKQIEVSIHNHKKQVDEITEQRDHLDNLLKGVNTELKNVEKQLADTRQQSEKTKKQLLSQKDNLNDQIDSLNSELINANERLAAKTQESTRIQNELESQRDHFRNLVTHQTDEIERLNARLQRETLQAKQTQKQLTEQRDELTHQVQSQTQQIDNLTAELKNTKQSFQKLTEALNEQQKRSEKKIAEMESALGVRNSELERVTSIAAKTLRPPVVGVNKCSSQLDDLFTRVAHVLKETSPDNELVEKLANAGMIEAVELFDNMRACVSQMNLALDGLLKVERVESTKVAKKTVDVTQLTEQILENKREILEERMLTVELEALPKCVADPRGLQQIFEQLIDNAIKYRKPDTPGAILISGWQADDEVIYCVADDGLGIPANEHDKAFAMFARIHEDIAPGSGLGLAIVRRIIDRHNGRTGLDSEPGKGSKFYFSIPAVQE